MLPCAWDHSTYPELQHTRGLRLSGPRRSTHICIFDCFKKATQRRRCLCCSASCAIAVESTCILGWQFLHMGLYYGTSRDVTAKGALLFLEAFCSYNHGFLGCWYFPKQCDFAALCYSLAQAVSAWVACFQFPFADAAFSSVWTGLTLLISTIAFYGTALSSSSSRAPVFSGLVWSDGLQARSQCFLIHYPLIESEFVHNYSADCLGKSAFNRTDLSHWAANRRENFVHHNCFSVSGHFIQFLCGGDNTNAVWTTSCIWVAVCKLQLSLRVKLPVHAYDIEMQQQYFAVPFCSFVGGHAQCYFLGKLRIIKSM